MSYYASEQCFRRYENIIAKALEEYPNSVRFKSPNRKCTTDAARCQNAISFYRTNQWPSTHTVFAFFEERPLSVWIEKDYCVIGPAVNRDQVEVIQGAGGGLHGSVKIMPTRPDQVKALVHMVNEGVFTDPIEMPKIWEIVARQEAEGMINIAFRTESSTIILF